MNNLITSIMIPWSLKCALYFLNFCRQSRQGCGMQSSLPYNSVVDHNLGPLKRKKKSHPIYSLPVDPHSPSMHLKALVGNKTYKVGLEYSWSCFLFTIKSVLIVLNSWPPVKREKHASCKQIMFKWHTHYTQIEPRWKINLLKNRQARKGNMKACCGILFHWQCFVDEEPEFSTCWFNVPLHF